MSCGGYGLERLSEETEIHVFRVILKPSLDEKACTRSITLAGPLSDPNELGRLTKTCCTLHLDPSERPFQLQRSHGVLEVS